MKLSLACVTTLALMAAAFSERAAAGEPGVKTPLAIGIAESILVGADDVVEVLEEKLGALMKEFTGLQGKLQVEKGIDALAQKVSDKKIHLAVFQGVEYAWMQKKYPKLKPLMASASDAKEKQHLHVLLLVRDEAKVKAAADLKGLTIALPKKSKEHPRLFMDKISGGTPAGFFKSIVHPVSVEAALDDLLAEKVDAVVADKTAAEFYRFLKPGAFRKLRVLETSAPFPASVVAYLEGGDLDDKTLDRIKQGMLKANTSERGQDLMSSWGITSFEPVFKNYQADLDAVLKDYPTPPKVSAK